MTPPRGRGGTSESGCVFHCGTEEGRTEGSKWMWTPVEEARPGPRINETGLLWSPTSFPGGSDGKESTCQCRRPRFDPWVGKVPWRRGNGNPLQDSCLENPMDRGAWQGYSPWESQSTVELDTTEQLIPSFPGAKFPPG